MGVLQNNRYFCPDLYPAFMEKTAIFLTAILLCFASLSVPAQDVTDDPDAKYAKELLSNGTPAPEFTLVDINGEPWSLSRFKGRKVVLVFWASWCPDCRAEIPLLKQMQAAADPREVAFVSVSFDRTREDFETYVKENYLGGVQLFDPAGKKDSPVATAYHVKWIPSLYLIDAEGKVLTGTVMAEKIAAAINSGPEASSDTSHGVCTEEGCL